MFIPLSGSGLIWCLLLFKVTQVKGHDHEDMVRDGRVRGLDRVGNNAADDAADFGRRGVPVAVIDARRNFARG